MSLARALAKWLSPKIEDHDSAIFIEYSYGGGDTESGFYSTYEVDMPKLEAEIDKFIQSFNKGK